MTFLKSRFLYARGREKSPFQKSHSCFLFPQSFITDRLRKKSARRSREVELLSYVTASNLNMDPVDVAMEIKRLRRKSAVLGKSTPIDDLFNGSVFFPHTTPTMNTSQPETPVNEGVGSAAVAATESRKQFDQSNSRLLVGENTGAVPKRFKRVRTSTPTPLKNVVDVTEFFRNLKPTAIHSRFDESYEPAKQGMTNRNYTSPTPPASSTPPTSSTLPTSSTHPQLFTTAVNFSTLIPHPPPPPPPPIFSPSNPLKLVETTKMTFEEEIRDRVAKVKRTMEERAAKVKHTTEDCL